MQCCNMKVLMGPSIKGYYVNVELILACYVVGNMCINMHYCSLKWYEKWSRFWTTSFIWLSVFLAILRFPLPVSVIFPIWVPLISSTLLFHCNTILFCVLVSPWMNGGIWIDDLWKNGCNVWIIAAVIVYVITDAIFLVYMSADCSETQGSGTWHFNSWIRVCWHYVEHLPKPLLASAQPLDLLNSTSFLKFPSLNIHLHSIHNSSDYFTNSHKCSILFHCSSNLEPPWQMIRIKEVLQFFVCFSFALEGNQNKLSLGQSIGWAATEPDHAIAQLFLTLARKPIMV